MNPATWEAIAELSELSARNIIYTKRHKYLLIAVSHKLGRVVDATCPKCLKKEIDYIKGMAKQKKKADREKRYVMKPIKVAVRGALLNPASLTDLEAIALLKENPARIVWFQKKPGDWINDIE